MFAKIITSENKKYYSEIFAMFSNGWDSTVITYNNETSKFEVINFYEKTPSLTRKVFIFDFSKEDFVKFDTIKLGAFKTLKNGEGYSWLLGDVKLLNAIINGKEVEESYKELGRKCNERLDLQEWRYIKNEKDIQGLLSAAFDFHDSYITNITLVNHVFEPERPRIEVVFEGCWGPAITLIFMGDLDLHFTLDDDRCMGELYEANIFFENDKIYWTDSEAKSFEEIDEEDIYFSGKVLKWKMDD